MCLPLLIMSTSVYMSHHQYHVCLQRFTMVSKVTFYNLDMFVFCFTLFLFCHLYHVFIAFDNMVESRRRRWRTTMQVQLTRSCRWQRSSRARKKVRSKDKGMRFGSKSLKSEPRGTRGDMCKTGFKTNNRMCCSSQSIEQAAQTEFAILQQQEQLCQMKAKERSQDAHQRVARRSRCK